jgi:hypothetical protein
MSDEPKQRRTKHSVVWYACISVGVVIGYATSVIPAKFAVVWFIHRRGIDIHVPVDLFYRPVFWLADNTKLGAYVWNAVWSMLGRFLP